MSLRGEQFMLNNYIERIKQVYPPLPIKDYYPNDIGQNNDVIIINNSLIFRFPKYKEGIEKLQKEKAILDRVRSSVSIPTPNFIYHSLEELEVGKVFTGYTLIEGAPLWREDFQKIVTKKMTRDLARQLVTFLSELHSISCKELEGIGLEDNNLYEEMSQLYQKIKEKIFPLIRIEAQKEIAYSFEKFLFEKNVSKHKVTLIHGDFGSSNIIWDPNVNKVTGIIDFGEAGLGDPAYDFAGILSSFGEDFFNMCISMYSNDIELSERAKFYKSTFALQEALHGIENDDIQAYKNGIKNFI